MSDLHVLWLLLMEWPGTKRQEHQTLVIQSDLTYATNSYHTSTVAHKK